MRFNLVNEIYQLPKLMLFTTILVPADLALDSVKYTIFSLMNTAVAYGIKSLIGSNEAAAIVEDMSFDLGNITHLEPTEFILEHAQEFHIGFMTDALCKLIGSYGLSIYSNIVESDLIPAHHISPDTLTCQGVELYDKAHTGLHFFKSIKPYYDILIDDQPAYLVAQEALHEGYEHLEFVYNVWLKPISDIFV